MAFHVQGAAHGAAAISYEGMHIDYAHVKTAREVLEETGIGAAKGRLERWPVASRFEIYAAWRRRFAPGVTHNTEHLFTLALPRRAPVRIAPAEHISFAWLPWREAALRCFSWSNRDAILMLGERAVIS